MIEEVHVPTDTSWFMERQEEYLNSPDFLEFQDITKVDLRKLSSLDPGIRRAAQVAICKKSIILNAIRTTIGDYFCPLVYTHELGLVASVPEHVLEADKKILAGDMCDSLRRRHLALSFSVLPLLIEELRIKKGTPIVIKNLGSGMGIDVINAMLELKQKGKITDYVQEVRNLDLDNSLLELGQKIKAYFVNRHVFDQDFISYDRKDLFLSRDKADLAILIGYICGTRDEFASRTLGFVRKTLSNGGKLVVSSSTFHMRSTDPLSNFLIQHNGLSEDLERGYPDDPLFGWPLNYRTKEQMYNVLANAGFKNITVYDDANFPGREQIEKKMSSEVDCIPSIALGLKSKTYQPYCLPPAAILERRFGYNWIAIAEK